MNKLYVTWDQLAEIRILENRCVYWDIDGNEHVNESKWIAGLEKILGKDVVDRYKNRGTIEVVAQ